MISHDNCIEQKIIVIIVMDQAELFPASGVSKSILMGATTPRRTAEENPRILRERENTFICKNLGFSFFSSEIALVVSH